MGAERWGNIFANITYLDDYLFAAALKKMCDEQVKVFLEICGQINFPVALEKTFWGTTVLVFLGLLLDTERQLVCIPTDKIVKALDMINIFLGKKKATVLQFQKLCGSLNFLCRCIVPGRAFLRRLYVQGNPSLKQHHHIKITQEHKLDLATWKFFFSYDEQVKVFLEICGQINFPVALEKTFWGTTVLVFLGLLLDTERQLVCIPTDKIVKALDMINIFLGKKKATVLQFQKLCGSLNFLCRCIVPGRAFLRRLYVQGNPSLKQHHHIKITQEHKLDLATWKFFFSCDEQVKVFLEICGQINFPVALEKTFWGTTVLVFLGLLLDTERQLVCIPTDKIVKALDMINIFLGKKKATVLQFQKLCGSLNFLCRCIVPGRAFLRRLYVQGNPSLKQHHHIKITQEHKLDLATWKFFFSCDEQVKVFLEICGQINFPVALEKTFWGTTVLVFLGLLLDTERQLVCIPTDKIVKALDMINIFLGKKKATVLQFQKLCGSLNFLCRCIVPGRAFLRRLYVQGNPSLKQHHHIKITQEHKLDLATWKFFLSQPAVFSRGFIKPEIHTAKMIDMYSDASRNFKLGIGAYCGPEWSYGKWDEEFCNKVEPSIDYLELFGVTVAVLNWLKLFKNSKIVLFCDNEAVVHMINNSLSRCKNCMVLIRIIVLESLVCNTRVFARYVRSKDNDKADALSRLQWDRFWSLAGNDMNAVATQVPASIWPMEKIWMF